MTKEYVHLCNKFFRDIHFFGGCGPIDCRAAFEPLDSFEGTPGLEEVVRHRTWQKQRYGHSAAKDSITFTSAEMQYLSDAQRTLADRIWSDSDGLDSFRFFSAAQISSIMKMEQKKRPDSWRGPFYDHFSCRILYYISHPVFLRNNTICIFSWSLGHAFGAGSFTRIYVKSKKGWEEFVEVFGSVGY